ncbi:MAG: ABC transporter ATP-binding protein [Woeseiaceae bacterium]|nr:ABC transporter ATP-binding protein [Woeseiaceae bacterium]
MNDAHAPLQASELRVSVPGRLLVDALDFDANEGEFIAVLGQNGCGKSLSLMTFAGLRDAEGGTVTLHGENVHAMPRHRVATRLALLPQHSDDQFPATVLETALTGRHPHIGRFRWESEDDRLIATRALERMGIADLAMRDVLTLSGGERRRLAIAQVLTQAPGVYLLDEPTNHLDPQHQIDALQLFRKLADDGSTIVASLHDANLAVRFADRCLLLYGDGSWDLGAASDILDASRLSRLYNTAIEAVPWRAGVLFVSVGKETQET